MRKPTMAEQTDTAEPLPVKATTWKRSALLLAAGLLVGAGTGALAAVPLAQRNGSANHADSHAADTLSATAGSDRDDCNTKPGSDGDASATHSYLLEDLVMNPAGSGGTRFLIATVAIGVCSPEAVMRLQARDVEVRDRVLGVLGSMTVHQLVAAQSDGPVRDSLRAAVQRPLAGMFSGGIVRHVMLPRLVVQ
jgi:flagellar protein FliL